MRLQILINLRLSRSLWALLLCFLSFVLLLLLPASVPVLASSTPVIQTPTGNGLGTPTPQGYATNIVLDFRQSQQFFDFEGGGTWLDGVGMVSEGNELHIKGNGNGYAPVSRVAFMYTALASGTFELTVTDGVTSVYHASMSFPACTNCTNIVFPLSNVAFDNLEIEVHSGALFTLKTITITALTGSVPTATVAVAGGCPILTEQQIKDLDPDYARSCSRCFATPTPVRGNQIPTRSFATPAPNGTATGAYGIPVIVSGTPQTATPGGGGVAPGITETPTPTGTYYPEVCMLDEGLDLFGNWDIQPFGFGYSTMGSFFGTYFQGEFDAGAEGKILRISRTWDGAPITRISVLIDEECTLGSSINHVIAGVEFDNVPFEYYHYSNSCPASQIGAQYEFEFDHETGVSEIDIIASTFSNSDDGLIHIRAVQICGELDLPPTATPNPTNTPRAWFNEPGTESPANCELVEFRNTDPLVEIPEFITVVDYNCYTLVPDLHINIPGQSEDFDMIGIELCVTWFSWPSVEFLGIPIPIELVIGMSVISWLIRRLLQF